MSYHLRNIMKKVGTPSLIHMIFWSGKTRLCGTLKPLKTLAEAELTQGHFYSTSKPPS